MYIYIYIYISRALQKLRTVNRKGNWHWSACGNR